MALFVWGRLRYDLVAVLALLAAIVAGIVPYDKAFSGFSDDIVIIVASALLVSAAVQRSGIVDTLLRPIAPYLTTADRAGGRAGGLGRAPVRLREEHRRAGDADAGGVPARAQEQDLGVATADADGVRGAARRHRHAGRHLAQRHRRAHARGTARHAVLDVRLHAGRRVPRHRRRDLPRLRLAPAAGRPQGRGVHGRGLQPRRLHHRGHDPGRLAARRQDRRRDREAVGRRGRGAHAPALARPRP